MRCPKCGFHSFGHLDFCKKCNTDLRPYKTSTTPAASPPPPAPPTPTPRTFDPNYQPPHPTAPLLPVLPSAYNPLPSPLATPTLPPPAEAAARTIPLEKLKLESQLKNGASWFYWIAVLSLINSVIILSGGKWNFLIGLGVTRFIDMVAHELAAQFSHLISIIAFIINLFIAGIFATFGIFAAKRHNWSFMVGMCLYAIDGLLCLLVRDFLGAAFHVLVLFFIFRGLQANRKIFELQQKMSY